ncbi:hypothetical protein GEMRC1_001762 [Eukaryota sp. GEM-RC1]
MRIAALFLLVCVYAAASDLPWHTLVVKNMNSWYALHYRWFDIDGTVEWWSEPRTISHGVESKFVIKSCGKLSLLWQTRYFAGPPKESVKIDFHTDEHGKFVDLQCTISFQEHSTECKWGRVNDAFVFWIDTSQV